MLVLVTALTQQPSGAAQAARQRRLAYDSTMNEVDAVGDRVAAVKSVLDLFRRAVFNAPDGEVVSTAEMFRERCHRLDSTATAAPRKICRTCAAPRVNAALVRYREVLPVLARTGAQCAARLRELSGGMNSAKRLRADVRNVGAAILAGVRPYERRLQSLLEAMGAVPFKNAPRRPPRR